MTKPTFEVLIQNIKKLITFPVVASELFQVIDDEASDAEAIARVIQKDPALTASLLKLANSAWYMARNPASSIKDAIFRIGLRDISKIALNISVQDTFSSVPENLYSQKDFFDHSLRCAFAAQEIASFLGVSQIGTLYAAGLLHDIGQVIMLNLYPEESMIVLNRNIDNFSGEKLYQCEQEVFDFNHADVGGALAKTWNFPSVLQACIQYHHLPSKAMQSKKEVYITHLANFIAILNEFDSVEIDDGPELDKKVFEAIGISMNKLPTIIKSSAEQFNKNREKMMRIEDE